jgi:shikimate kinase
VVVGTSGSGKTTFARRLAARLHVAHIELDALYWLDYSLSRVVSQVLTRTLGRALWREELFGGNRESLRSAFLSRESILL